MWWGQIVPDTVTTASCGDGGVDCERDACVSLAQHSGCDCLARRTCAFSGPLSRAACAFGKEVRLVEVGAEIKELRSELITLDPSQIATGLDVSAGGTRGMARWVGHDPPRRSVRGRYPALGSR